MIQNVLFQGVPAPGDASLSLTVSDLAHGETRLRSPSWVVGALATAPEIVRDAPDGHATATLNPATHRA